MRFHNVAAGKNVALHDAKMPESNDYAADQRVTRSGSQERRQRYRKDGNCFLVDMDQLHPGATGELSHHFERPGEYGPRMEDLTGLLRKRKGWSVRFEVTVKRRAA